MSTDRPDLHALARERFHCRELPAFRRDAVAALLDGRSALVVAHPAEPTSTSAPAALCWELAATARGGQVVAVTPSDRGLAERAERLAHVPGLVAAHVYAGLTADQLDRLGQQLAAGRRDVVLVSVRHLGDPRVRRAVERARPWLLAVEGAERLSSTADRYDPSSRRLLDLRRAVGDPQVMAIAPVASEPALEDVEECLDLSRPARSRAPLLPANLRIEVHNLPSESKRDGALVPLLRPDTAPAVPARTIIYASMRVHADKLVPLIEHHCGLPAAALDAGMPGADFARTLERFRQGAVRVLVTTGALELREEVAVPLVIHYSLPESPEMYVRQTLTAGRDGAPARSVLLYDRHEHARLRRMAWRGASSAGHLLAMHRAIHQHTGAGRISYAVLSTLTGLHADDVHRGVEALARMGAVVVEARGDEWLEASAGPPPDAASMHQHARDEDRACRARLERAEVIIEYARARRCRREVLAEMLGSEAPPADDCCDRCRPTPPPPSRAPSSTGYRIQAGDFGGWTLDLYRPPGSTEPGRGPGRLMHDLKYENADGLAERLAWLMARAVRARRRLRECDVIVPVPSSDPDNLASPPVLLAEALGELIERPVAHALISTHRRTQQKELDGLKAKRANVADAFEVVEEEQIGRRIVLLVDDIFDSGATLQEAARELTRAGAADVRLLTAVRTTFGWRRDV